MIQTSNKFTRINKTKAHNLFNKNVSIFVVPCKVDCTYLHMWIQPVRITKHNTDDFDKAINEFSWYNCNDNETGLYAAYYIIR